MYTLHHAVHSKEKHPLPFLENLLFFEGGGLKNVTSVDHVFFTNLTPPPPPPWRKNPLFFDGGGGEDVTGGGDVHVTNLRGGSVKNVTGDACSPN